MLRNCSDPSPPTFLKVQRNSREGREKEGRDRSEEKREEEE